ncbi:hypothetical protein QC763_103545 [Podospora pseudopauciseta]|uniref:Uncharacterized protein n=1 Tax=Podospora pseudopauciseta TaxID=2093780 RepID=A0ABR0HX25_9PEZI|nr:hypothetical protein QC763_103545 [Podospora pseudopauciseta]
MSINGLSVFLATLERKIVGRLSIPEADKRLQHRSVTSIQEENHTMTLHLTPQHLTPQLQVSNVKLDIGNLLVPTYFDGLKPVEEYVEEHDADQAVVLIPYQNFRAMTGAFTTPAITECFITQALADYLPHADLWFQIKTFCMEAHIQSWPEDTILLTIEASLRAQDYEAFVHVASNGQIESSQKLVSAVEKAVVMRLGCLLSSKQSTARFAPIKAFSQFFTQNDSCQAFLSAELVKLVTLAQNYQNLGRLDRKSLGASDAVALVDFSLDYLDVGFLEFRIMPIVSDPRAGLFVILGFIQRLLERTVVHDIQHDTALRLYQKLETSSLSKLHFENLTRETQQSSKYW